MQKISYTGNGKTKEFHFNFPYFENSNIIVTKNNIPTTDYNVIGTSGGLNADIPYTGGKIVFETAPTTLDTITITRQLPLTRIVDYQPTTKLDPTTLNQDLNYLTEILKDFNDEIAHITTKYHEITNKESNDILLEKFTIIHEEIITFNAQLTELQDIIKLSETVNTNTQSISEINKQTSGLIDYVIEYQEPTSNNNYTWYRKYKSGWIEQGGIGIAEPQSACQITYPITMSNANYTLIAFSKSPHETSADTVHGCHYTGKTRTGCSIISLNSQGNWLSNEINWYVYGFCV